MATPEIQPGTSEASPAQQATPRDNLRITLQELLDEIPAIQALKALDPEHLTQQPQQSAAAEHQAAPTENTGLNAEVTPEAVADLNLQAFQGEEAATQVAQETTGPEQETPTPAKSTAKEEFKPFLLSDSHPMIPARLVKRILKGEFIEMAELLKDNMEADRRRSLRESSCGASSHTAHPSEVARREIPDALSWLHCFSIYAAVICSKWPEKHRQLFAYQVLILNKSRRGGRGWRMYDFALRQQITDLETFDFSAINQSLYATTCVQFAGNAWGCPLCGLGDHQESDCALLSMKQDRDYRGSGRGSSSSPRPI